MVNKDPLESLPDEFTEGVDSFYDLLEIPANANQGEVKRAYREKIRRYHPDTCDEPYAEKLTFVLNRGMDVLDKQSERMLYNELGHKRYYHQMVSTSEGTSSTPIQTEEYERSTYDLIKMANLTIHTREPWWKVVLKSKGFKITVYSTLIIGALFAFLLYI